MQQSPEEKTLEVRRGLYLIEYASADDDVHPPKITVSVDRGDGDISLISSPDFEQGVLWSPGACLVAQAAQAGRLRFIVSPSISNGSTAAQVHLISLSSDPSGVHRRGSETSRLDLSSLRVLGHVAGKGDVTVRTGEWIAGPAAPSRIEGFAIQWPNKPRTINIRYAARVGGANATNTPFVEIGAFAGTRGKALPLVGAALEISGAEAAAYELAVDAIFLGSPQMRILGQRVVLSGPTGREPLVGLRIAIESSERNSNGELTSTAAGAQMQSTAAASALRRNVARSGR
jgi:hypothetical protein